MTALSPRRRARSSSARSSACCAGTVSPVRDGQSMLATVAIHRPRNSRRTVGSVSTTGGGVTTTGGVATGGVTGGGVTTGGAVGSDAHAVASSAASSVRTGRRMRRNDGNGSSRDARCERTRRGCKCTPRCDAQQRPISSAPPVTPPAPSPIAELPTRVLAVDWSGARVHAERKIWLCEVDARGVQRLESGRTREALVDHVCTEGARDPRLVVGFDFAFAFPAWFGRTVGRDAPTLWRAARDDGETWLLARVPPFWGRKGGARRDGALDGFRRTEREVAAQTGLRPLSSFQVGGAGSVGTGSVRGMPHLLTLREAGFAIWPFDTPVAGTPTAIEIWPRLTYGEPVVKARAEARAAWVARHAPTLAPPMRRAAEASDDAFDALAAGLAMWAARASLAALPSARDDLDRLEGRIWGPPATG